MVALIESSTRIARAPPTEPSGASVCHSERGRLRRGENDNEESSIPRGYGSCHGLASTIMNHVGCLRRHGRHLYLFL
ncbi:hypothetical protein RRG08_057759 [Elysia crispata]|uniref:Uncharacterized protein n=1 Tax=Elysia crispata TaxID=231223 RepID=A0AAE0YJA6_9GAST|nr:hypothetical protein RRG08_057759 [Elysia crispata]